MVLESSAVMAILREEPESDDFAALLAGADDPLMLAASLFECSMVAHRRVGSRALERLNGFL